MVRKNSIDNKAEIVKVGTETYEKIKDDVVNAATELEKRLKEYMDVQTKDPKVKLNYDLAVELLRKRMVKEEGTDIGQIFLQGLKTLGPIFLQIVLAALKSLKK